MDQIFAAALVSREWPTLIRYIITTLAVFGAYFIHVTLFADTAGYLFLLYFPVVITTGFFFDQGNGIYATVLSTLFSSIFIATIVDERGEAASMLAILIFFVTGFVIAISAESMHKSVIRLMAANAALSASERSKAFLLRELAHRTRNDLSALNSLFLLQAHSLKDLEAKKAFERAADRMQIIARVHQRLTYDDDPMAIDGKQFITDLCDDLKLSLFAGRPIALELSIVKHVLDHQRAIAIGLIVNELLTNALKYGFPDDRTGTISVHLGSHGTDYHLRVSDDGAGMTSTSPVESSRLGLELVRTLAAQIGGKLERLPTLQGTSFQVVFPRIAR